MQHSRLYSLSVVFLLTALTVLTARGQTTLSILNPATSGSTINLEPGQSFSAEVMVSGLTTPLDSFSLTFVLPTGVTLQSFTDTIPSGWIPLSNIPQDQYGGANLSGNDITSSGELVVANFSTSDSVLTGSTLTFASMGLLQTLSDAEGNSIPYSVAPLTVDVISVPEPDAWLLLVMGLVILTASGNLWFARTPRKRGLPILDAGVSQGTTLTV